MFPWSDTCQSARLRRTRRLSDHEQDLLDQWTQGTFLRTLLIYATHCTVLTGSHLLVMFLVGWLLFCLCCCFCVFVFRSLCFVFKVPCQTITFLFSVPLYYYGFAFGFTVGFLLVCLFGVILVFSCFVIDQYILYYFLFLFS